MPDAWTPGTEGPVRGAVVRATLKSLEDLEEWTGKLSGKIVLLEDAPEPEQIDAVLFERLNDEGLREVSQYDVPNNRRSGTNSGSSSPRFSKRKGFWQPSSRAPATTDWFGSRGTGLTARVTGRWEFRR